MAATISMNGATLVAIGSFADTIVMPKKQKPPTRQQQDNGEDQSRDLAATHPGALAVRSGRPVPYCGPARIDAGCPGSLKRWPVLVS
jgi:hypothetical protein